MPLPIPGRGGLGDGSFDSFASLSSERSIDPLCEPPPPATPDPIQPFPRRSFPAELLDRIFSHVTEYPDMHTILGVSRQFYALMLPHIWKHISVRPQIEGHVISTLAGQIDKRCSLWKTRGEQVQTLDLAVILGNVKEPSVDWKDLREAYVPIHRLLAKLPNLRTLSLNVASAALKPDVHWQRTDIDMYTRLPRLKTVVFVPLQIEIDVGDGSWGYGSYGYGCPTHPITPFDTWLLAQESIEYFEYGTCHLLVQRFPPNSLPGLRRLKMTASNIEVVRGMEGPRGITHLNMTVPFPCPFAFPEIPLPELPSGSPRLPPALNNVTVLARGDGDFEFAGLLPKLERLDVAYKGRNLGHLLAALRAEDEHTHAPCSVNLQELRFLRACGLRLAPKEDKNGARGEGGIVSSSVGGDGGRVADIFTELPALEEFEAMWDDWTWIRYARDGSTRFVKWKCVGDSLYVGRSEEWCQDWEGGVSSVDPTEPSFFCTVRK